MAEHLETFQVCRSICDGQRGYSVTLPNGVSFFHFNLQDSFRDLLRLLGHATDRDIMVIGEPEEGNVW